MGAKLIGSIEGGGTKFVCAVIDEENQILAETRILTTNPEQTLGACLNFFKEQELSMAKLGAMHIADFGQLDAHPGSPTYGHILTTPKSG